MPATRADGNTVWFAVRPEKIKVSSKQPEDQRLNAAEGEIWDIAYLGDMTVYHVRLDDGRDRAGPACVNSQRADRGPARAGTTAPGSRFGRTPASC